VDHRIPSAQNSSHRIASPAAAINMHRQSGAVGQASYRIASSLNRGVIVLHRMAGAALSHRIASDRSK